MRYQWFLTLQWNTPQGTRASSRAGTWTVQPGDTRESVSSEIIASVKRTEGAESAVVLFFSLDPDDL
jgi:hypothetical protein